MLLNNFTLLHIDDNMLIKHHINTLLKGKVKDLYFANSGKEGLEIYFEKKPDIIISDIEMPGLDGLEMSRVIKNSNKEQPIILLSGFNNKKNLKKAIKVGVDSVISKPLKKKKMLRVLENTAKKIQYKRELKIVEELENDKEKKVFMINMIKELNHHWRQPLSTMLLISSSFERKKKMKRYKNEKEEIKDMELISKEIIRLSDILKEMELLELDNVQIKELENIIKISNPSGI